jgi:MFS-type transporter involved in bile tolerance (Atg22 family)
MTTEADENGKSNLSHRRHSYALQDHTDEHLSETMISLEMSPMEERAENHPHIKYVPCCLRHDDGPPEATGLTLDFYARATVLMSSIFLGPALLQLATESAGCASEQDCDARVMGMKPSSLLSNIAVATGILASILMPTLGAIVDHTSYRLQVGTYSGYIISVVKGLEAMVSSKTWFYVAILQVLSGTTFSMTI